MKIEALYNAVKQLANQAALSPDNSANLAKAPEYTHKVRALVNDYAASNGGINADRIAPAFKLIFEIDGFNSSMTKMNKYSLAQVIKGELPATAKEEVTIKLNNNIVYRIFLNDVAQRLGFTSNWEIFPATAASATFDMASASMHMPHPTAPALSGVGARPVGLFSAAEAQEKALAKMRAGTKASTEAHQAGMAATALYNFNALGIQSAQGEHVAEQTRQILAKMEADRDQMLRVTQLNAAQVAQLNGLNERIMSMRTSLGEATATSRAVAAGGSSSVLAMAHQSTRSTPSSNPRP